MNDSESAHSGTDAAETGRLHGVGEFLRENRRLLLVAVGLVLVATPFLVTSSVLFNISLVFVFGLLAFAAIVPIGYTGQLILCQGALFGIGAYTFVKLAGGGLPGLLAVVAAVAVTGVVANLLGRPAISTGGIYLGILTLAFNELFIISLNLFSGFTGGSQGLTSPPLLPALPVDESVALYFVVLAAFAVTYRLVARELRSETGWAFLAVKENPMVAESIGIDATQYRLRAFTLSGLVCGLAGGLYAPINGYVTPTTFNLDATIKILLAGVTGGIATPVGALFGPGVVVLVPEYLRFLADYRLIVYGVLLILLLVYLPSGIGGWLQREL